jgi:hypothetical protein
MAHTKEILICNPRPNPCVLCLNPRELEEIRKNPKMAKAKAKKATKRKSKAAPKRKVAKKATKRAAKKSSRR